MTKLDAVNDILLAVGRDRVKSTDTGGASPAAEAERVLDRCELDVQALGWHYNTRTDVELEPDGNSHIPVPTGVITIDSMDGEIDVTQLGDLLYNKEDNTSTFDSSIKVMYTLRYLFHCIPHIIQMYIVACAAVEYNLTRFGMADRQPRLEAMKLQRWGMAAREDEDKRDTDILATVDVLRVRGYRVPSGSQEPVAISP